jgi:hypothetical protein
MDFTSIELSLIPQLPDCIDHEEEQHTRTPSVEDRMDTTSIELSLIPQLPDCIDHEEEQHTRTPSVEDRTGTPSVELSFLPPKLPVYIKHLAMRYDQAICAQVGGLGGSESDHSIRE